MHTKRWIDKCRPSGKPKWRLESGRNNDKRRALWTVQLVLQDIEPSLTPVVRNILFVRELVCHLDVLDSPSVPRRRAASPLGLPGYYIRVLSEERLWIAVGAPLHFSRRSEILSTSSLLTGWSGMARHGSDEQRPPALYNGRDSLRLVWSSTLDSNVQLTIQAKTSLKT